MAATRSRNVGVLSTLQAELMPFPGRLAGSLRDTLGIVIALVLAMTLRVPGIALALSLLFLLQRERPGVTLRSAVQMLGGGVAACAATLLWVQLTDGTEVARYLGIALGIFIAAFGMATTSLPLLFTLFGFYGFVDLGAWDAHRSPNAIVTTSLDGVAALAIVMLSAVAVEYLFGSRRPSEELEGEMRKRLVALSRFFHLLAQDPASRDPEQLRSLLSSLVQHAHAGEVRLNQLYDRVRDASPTLAKVPLGLHYRIGLLARVLEKSAVLGFDAVLHQDRFDRAESAAGRADYAADRADYAADRADYAAIAAQCDRLIDGNAGIGSHMREKAQPFATSSSRPLDIHTELEQYAASLESPESTASRAAEAATQVPPAFRLFRADAFASAGSALYALKLTLAATLCYTVYNAVGWPGILTCVITVLFTGLSPTGQMKQRQLYRFFGTAVGGVFAIAAESLLFPNMDSITALVVVVGAVAFIAGWVLRSPHIGSVGIQIGFAFFLTTLQGFSATTQLATARDRIIGVTLGVVVMWFIFDQLWPTRTSHALSQILQRIRAAAAQLQQTERQRDPGSFAQTLSRLRVAVSQDLASMRLLESGAYFDFGRGHLRELAESRRLTQKIETAASEFYTEALRQRSDDRI
jgi:multidrug resistance protein MdtO